MPVQSFEQSKEEIVQDPECLRSYIEPLGKRCAWERSGIVAKTSSNKTVGSGQPQKKRNFDAWDSL